jgi:hypothetical protein
MIRLLFPIGRLSKRLQANRDCSSVTLKETVYAISANIKEGTAKRRFWFGSLLPPNIHSLPVCTGYDTIENA